MTVCTEKRSPWLAQTEVHQALHQIWKDRATAWLVSDYILMPGHLHLFCAPKDLKFAIERWISFWKDQFTKEGVALGTFPAGGFHHRLRDEESYSDKWQYASENPVRQGLAQRPEEWPFRGRVHDVCR